MSGIPTVSDFVQLSPQWLAIRWNIGTSSLVYLPRVLEVWQVPSSSNAIQISVLQTAVSGQIVMLGEHFGVPTSWLWWFSKSQTNEAQPPLQLWKKFQAYIECMETEPAAV